MMDGLITWPPTWATLLLLPALLVGFTVHELAHAIVAYLLGDTSQVERNRLSFNPLRHISWIGAVAFMLLGLGWAKPVWADYSRFRIKNRAFGLFLVSIAGPAANLVTALVVLVAIGGTVTFASQGTGAGMMDAWLYMFQQKPELDTQAVVVALTGNMVTVNLLLAFFNMLPIPTLDGFQATMSLFRVLYEAISGRKAKKPAPAPAARAPASGDPVLTPAQIHFNIGLDYQREGEWDEAIARYRQAIAHDDNFGRAYYNLGLAYWAKGRLPLAVSAFRAAMRSSREVGLRIQADLRLRELAQAEQQGEAVPEPEVPPLELGSSLEVAADPAEPLDPTVQRQLWMRLGIGGAVVLVLALATWVAVTVVVVTSLG